MVTQTQNATGVSNAQARTDVQFTTCDVMTADVRISMLPSGIRF